MLSEIKEVFRIHSERKAERAKFNKLVKAPFDYNFMLLLVKLANNEDKNVRITLTDGTAIDIMDPFEQKQQAKPFNVNEHEWKPIIDNTEAKR